MRTIDKTYPWKKLIVMTATETVDLATSKAAFKKLAHDPKFLRGYEVLLDWRDVSCKMSGTDVYELAQYLSDQDTELPTHKKIPILVSGRHAFDHVNFLEVCSNNRRVALAAFEDFDKASAWLNATLPQDTRKVEAYSTPRKKVRAPLVPRAEGFFV